MYYNSERPKKEKKYAKEEAKLKAADFCAYQERSQQEVRDKLYDYGLHQEDVEEVISLLITEGFVNEERFARAYIRGKFRLKKWGKIKIANGLIPHKISDYCLKKGWEEIDEEEYHQVLINLIDKKNSSLKETSLLIKKRKIAQYAIQKGFEPSLVWDYIRNLKL
ncbi:MAG: regulatory protein RecX [Bacteroidota bacterium]